MKYINDIKNSIGNFLIKRAKTPVRKNVSALNLADVKTVLILFNPADKDSFPLVRKYIGYLKEWEKDVIGLGYFDEKEIPPITFSKHEFLFFSNKELNWCNFPKTQQLKKMIVKPYDLLIDLNVDDLVPLKYIAVQSKAAFKVGQANDENKDMHDLSIATGANNTVKFLLQQLDVYLNMINSKEKQQAS